MVREPVANQKNKESQPLVNQGIGSLYDISASDILRKSEGTLNLTRTQAARADIDTFNLTVNDSANTLNVRFPGTSRLQMGMADVVAGQLAFCADFTYMCHVLHLLVRICRISPTQYVYSTTRNVG